MRFGDGEVSCEVVKMEGLRLRRLMYGIGSRHDWSNGIVDFFGPFACNTSMSICT